MKRGLDQISYEMAPGCVTVFLGMKTVGHIKQEPAPEGSAYMYQWRYCPVGAPRGSCGEAYNTIAEVKRSLEG